MKIKLQRFSGRPVLLENLDKYEAEFKQEFDKIAAEAGTDMLKMHEELAKLDERLKPKYNVVEAIELPTSRKAWKKLMETYECPLMIAKSSEPPFELVVVLVDEKFI